jgi:hypothetical protein
MHSGYWLLATVLLPLIVGGVMIVIPDDRKDIVRWLSVITGAILFALSTYIFFAYEVGRSDAPYQFFIRYDWLENVAFLGPHGISLALGVDGIAAPMVLLTGVVAFGGSMISWKIEHHNKDFFVLFWVLVAGVYGTFESLDLFFFFFWYEVAVLPMYLLVAVWGSSSVFETFARSKEYSAMKLTIMLVSASILIFIGIFAVFHEAGLGTFDLQTLYAYEFDEDFQKLVFPLIVIGCGVLAGLWPFHTWSPDGHVSAPTAVSMLHAGVLMKLGAFGIIRLGIQLLPAGATFWMPGLVRRFRRDRTARLQVHDRVLLREPHGPGADGIGDHECHWRQRRGAADVRARRHDGDLLRHGWRRLRPDPHARHAFVQRAGEPHAALRVLLRDRGAGVVGLTGPRRLCRRVQHLRRNLPHVPLGRRAWHLCRGDDSGLHPAHDVDGHVRSG